VEDETPIVIPTWTKGPPTTPEEVAEYKAFMKVSWVIDRDIMTNETYTKIGKV